MASASVCGQLQAADSPFKAAGVESLGELLREIDRRLVETALVRARQNRSKAAESLGISRPRLSRRIKELNRPDDTETESEPVPAGPPARAPS